MKNSELIKLCKNFNTLEELENFFQEKHLSYTKESLLEAYNILEQSRNLSESELDNVNGGVAKGFLRPDIEDITNYRNIKCKKCGMPMKVRIKTDTKCNNCGTINRENC